MKSLALSFHVQTDPAVEFAAAGSSDNAAGHLAGLALPFGVPSDPAEDGERYQFSGPPDNPQDLVDVVQDHNPDHLAGRLAAPWYQGTTGLSAKARIFNTSRGRDIITEGHEGARRAFSVGTLIHRFRTDAEGVRHVEAWSARHLGVVRRPAFTQTQGFAMSASALAPESSTRKDTPKMTDTPKVEPLPTVQELADKVRAELDLPTVADLAAQVREVLHTDEDHHPLAKFPTFEAFAAGFMAADPEARAALQVAFAIPDQITGNNPGVMPPGWRNDVKMNLDARRPAIASMGGPISLPTEGMDANWPYLDPATDLDTIVADQAAENTALSGIALNILKGTETIKTAGTVSALSFQLLMRSSPSYYAAYLRICLAAWARFTEAKFQAKLLSGGTASATLLSSVTGSADAFRGELFTASSAVEDATGAPADVVLVASDIWKTVGALPGLHNPAYGTQNVAGTSSARTLVIDVNGLRVKRGKFLTAGTMVVTNGEAAKFAESGPRVATGDDVTKLARDAAVWGMYEDGEVYYPTGIQTYSG